MTPLTAFLQKLSAAAERERIGELALTLTEQRWQQLLREYVWSSRPGEGGLPKDVKMRGYQDGRHARMFGIEVRPK